MNDHDVKPGVLIVMAGSVHDWKNLLTGPRFGLKFK